MPSDETIRRFRDTVENIDRIERHCEGLSESEFARDPLVMDAVERCLQRITEASIHVQPFAPDNFPMQDRGEIRKLGNLLRHGYEIIRPAMIWQIMQIDLPALRTDCQRAIGMLERG